MTDERKMIRPGDSNCSDFYERYLEQQEHTYAVYNFHISTMATSNISFCDTALDPLASCVSQALLRYENQLVRIMESIPGIEKKDIMLNIAAIVGALQFVYWAFVILTPPLGAFRSRREANVGENV